MPKEIKKDESSPPPQTPDLDLLSRAVVIVGEELVEGDKGTNKTVETGTKKVG